MIHIYCGLGKGKTTAACGLCIRAVGSGGRVLLTQLFKNGSSSELRMLERLDGVELALPELYYGRYKTMTDAQRVEIKGCYTRLLERIAKRAEKFDMIILDEVISAYRYNAIDRDLLLELLRREGERRELVLTGREPLPELLELADYVTDMQKLKHPFDRGITARLGIEY